MTREQIELKYDEFFGKGYWEEQYKKHIVEFAFQCSNGGKPLVSSSLPLEQLAEKIIDSLDDCSRDYGSYEYGLPMINDEEMQKMKAIVVRLLSGNAS